MSQVQKSHHHIVVFDLDYTVTKNDTFLSFLGLVLLRRPMRWPAACLLPFFYIWHKAGRRDNEWLKERFLSCVAGGLSRERLEHYRNLLVPRILARDIRDGAREALRRHRDAGDYLVLASASFDFYVVRLAAELGFSETVCTLADWNEGGTLSGKIDGRNCYGDEKVRRLNSVITRRANFRRIVYTDHHSDLPLCRWANEIRLVKPTAKLLRALADEPYQLLDW